MFKQSFLLLITLFITIEANYVNKNINKPGRVRFYPKNSVFRKSDLIDRGCVVFIKDCPAAYKRNFVCGRHYDGHYKTFNNYCELEYENCNSWRQKGFFNKVS
ncbi:uncharacterized protein LOC126778316 isoform X3 [Nymphalis io]|uniref:uncharacterized protein LOC126778316 isoform X3 n=1 Tax=Inachis io TaxID=171585 RepID=UPI00216AA3FE|nr:uncharacterized protein LOC126778316 isoform X3 [Nymphalis io]